ncbi:MAG TPA: FAD-dependent oxidoreductase, partial [Jatrophihabitantaceae bacterium]|nr:FAD-dependent oxidoreductase [Jatrophihabitantaceae bacterium]
MGTSAIVVGGGLAGIAAALRLADAGATVSLVEGRPRLGGAAFSFRRGDLSVDNGQHVFLRCCEAYRELVRRLDGEENVVLQPRLSIPILAPGGRSTKLSRLPGVPAPLHLSAALAGYRLLSVTERARAVAGALALRRLDPANAALDAQTLGAFLRDHGQTDAIIAALWGVVGTATLNLHPDEASLALAAKVFRTGLLDHAPASDVGYAATPLGALHSEAAARALDAAGVEVLLAHRAERVEPVDAGMSVAARGRDGSRRLLADAVVLAVPHYEAFPAAPVLADTRAAGAADLGSSAIVNVHVIYDRRVTDLPFAAAVRSPVQWFFDRTDTSGLTQ